MNLRRRKSGNTSGGVLLATVISTMVVGMVLVGYMTLVGSANRDAARSEAWNMALVVAETGIEEAMAHLQRNFPTNMLSHGWLLSGTNLVKTRTNNDTYYDVRISVSTAPEIVSKGFATFSGENVYIARTLRVSTMSTGIVAKAFATKLDIKLNGNNVYSDSYDSTDPNLSGAGGAYDPAKTSDKGDISTNLGTDWAFDAGNADIKGKVATGPDGQVELGPNVVVGSTSWHAGANSGAEPGWVLDDSNVIMPSVESPSMVGSFSPGSRNVGGTNYQYVLPSGTFQVDRLTGSVLVSGDVVLRVNETVNIAGLDFIRILPGASLKLYVAAPRANIAGQAVINESLNPASFIYYGLPSNEFLSLAGGSDFYGLLYAPDTSLSLSGGGDMFGAVVSEDAQINGNYGFHFDESLNKLVELQRMTIVSWVEL